MLYTHYLLGGLSLLPTTFALALPHDRDHQPELQTLSNFYTLTVYKPHDRKLNALKVEENYGGFGIYQASTASYCPEQVGACPNGTELAFDGGTLYPYSIVPGGQDSYVESDGLIQITVQHSHSFPPGSYPEYEGWTWTAFPVFDNHNWWHNHGNRCPKDNPIYNCDPPSGFFDFKAPNATVGGVMACPSTYNSSATVIYAVTPDFKRTDCVKLDGLATHNYTGEPVWAYY
ncbi:hypothetical protein K432DRAFT_106049 [Lepidopterella palustris CBS 459.81]|uniref:Uncharacterized protein n=1 Tax=Lepidopterella palustris CBS 459.81 TaxID=1314670 RepID=A0A8E2EII0_9PEZI|nr:hypothetical protein K432DRAFT_106049 [Lepidopterella palustris CBS 459.81]